MFAAFVKKRADEGVEDPYGDHWDERFPTLMTKCDAINSKRNKLIHSFYDHIEAGDEVIAIVRSKFKTGRATPSMDVGNPIAAALKDIADISFDISQARTQLVAWT